MFVCVDERDDTLFWVCVSLWSFSPHVNTQVFPQVCKPVFRWLSESQLFLASVSFTEVFTQISAVTLKCHFHQR